MLECEKRDTGGPMGGIAVIQCKAPIEKALVAGCPDYIANSGISERGGNSGEPYDQN